MVGFEGEDDWYEVAKFNSEADALWIREVIALAVEQENERSK